MFDKSFAEHLKALRETKGLTKTAVSRATGLAMSTISRLESNDAKQWRAPSRNPNMNATRLILYDTTMKVVNEF